MSQTKTKILKSAPKILKNFPVVFAYLYGSYATGLEHSFSDIDISIYTDTIAEELKLSIQMEIALQIDEKLQHKSPAEVRIMNDLPLIIKGQIVTNGILIYSKSDDIRADVESYIRRSYFDFLPVIQHYQQSYINHTVS